MVIQSPFMFSKIWKLREIREKYHILQVLILQQVMLDLFCYNKKA